MSAIETSETFTLSGTAQQRLKSFVDRIERLTDDRDAVSADLREVYAEAQGEGFDVAVLRKVVKLRSEDLAKRQEMDALVDLYISACAGV